MNILITGGAGFIGAHVARTLLARGETITIIDDFNNRYNPRLKEARVSHLLKQTPSLTITRADIRDRDRLTEIFQNTHFEKVIHLAAWASVQPSIVDPYTYTAVNIDGTVNVLEAARRHQIKSLVFASSSSVYGGLTEVPFREEVAISQPISPYAATKAAGELLCATWHKMYGIPIIALRFFTVYGPWGRPEMALFKFAEAIRTGQPVYMRGATTTRDFTYIDDIVQGVIQALDRPRGFSIYNLGENDAVPLPRLIAALEDALQKKAEVVEVPLPYGDIPKTLADISKAKSELGHHPVTSIEAGVAHFVDWYQSFYVPAFAERVKT